MHIHTYIYRDSSRPKLCPAFGGCLIYIYDIDMFIDTQIVYIYSSFWMLPFMIHFFQKLVLSKAV